MFKYILRGIGYCSDYFEIVAFTLSKKEYGLGSAYVATPYECKECKKGH